MKFKFIGDSENMIAFGYDFTNGNEPDVTDSHAIGKLSGNSFFEQVKDEEIQVLPIEVGPAPVGVETVPEGGETIPFMDVIEDAFPEPPKKKKG
jgi:hypothetical protein